MKKHTKYTDYLTDLRFIRWQLVPDNELSAFWSKYIEQYPDSSKEMQRAIDYLKGEGLNSCMLDELEKQELLNSFLHPRIKDEKRKKLKIVKYSLVSAVAAVAIIVAIGIFIPSNDTVMPVEKELIVGEILNSEDIQLITSEESISFQSDITVTLDNDGTAEIVHSDKEASKVEIASDKLNSLVVPYGKRSTLTLADGSKIWLNSGTVLKFPAQFSGDTREIQLASGEIYIEVAPDDKKPFQVKTSQFDVRVYGTKFNLTTYSNTLHSVVLVEGSIGLHSVSNKELLLKPDQQAIYNEDAGFTTQDVDVSRFISWKSGYMAFDKTPMTEVLQQIGRYYNLSFDFERDVNLLRRTCTGKIYLSENIDNVMTTIGLLTSTKYEKQNNQIYITNK